MVLVWLIGRLKKKEHVIRAFYNALLTSNPMGPEGIRNLASCLAPGFPEPRPSSIIAAAAATIFTPLASFFRQKTRSKVGSREPQLLHGLEDLNQDLNYRNGPRIQDYCMPAEGPCNSIAPAQS